MATRSRLTEKMTPLLPVVTVLYVANRFVYGPVVRNSRVRLLSVLHSSKLSFHPVRRSVVLLSWHRTRCGRRSLCTCLTCCPFFRNRIFFEDLCPPFLCSGFLVYDSHHGIAESLDNDQLLLYGSSALIRRVGINSVQRSGYGDAGRSSVL